MAAWRMPNGYGLTENDSLFAGSAITLILLAGLYLLLKNAFQITDRRLNRTAYFLGGMFAIVTVVCADVRANNGFSAFRWLPFLYGVLAAASCYGGVRRGAGAAVSRHEPPFRVPGESGVCF